MLSVKHKLKMPRRHTTANFAVRRRVTQASQRRLTQARQSARQQRATEYAQAHQCMVVAPNGVQCPNQAVPIVSDLDLTHGLDLAGFATVPSLYCCKLCKSHLIAVLSIYAYSAYTNNEYTQRAAHKILQEQVIPRFALK
jgi:hypothetical protein